MILVQTLATMQIARDVDLTSVTISSADCYKSNSCSNNIRVIVTASDNTWSCAKSVPLLPNAQSNISDAEIASGICTLPTLEAIITQTMNTGDYIIQVFECQGVISLQQFRSVAPYPPTKRSAVLDAQPSDVSSILTGPPPVQCPIFNVYLKEMSSSTTSVAESRQYFSKVGNIWCISASDLKVSDSTQFGVFSSWLWDLHIAGQVGVTCIVGGTKFTQLYQIVETSVQAENTMIKFDAAETGTSTVYYDGMYAVNLYDIGQSVRFVAGNIAVAQIKCGQYISDLGYFIPTSDEVILGQLRVRFNISQSSDKAALLNYFASQGTSCPIILYLYNVPLISDTTPIAIQVAENDSAIVKYDVDAQKLLISTIQPTNFADCTSYYLFLKGNNADPILQYEYRFTSMMISNQIFSVFGMVFYKNLTKFYLDQTSLSAFWKNFLLLPQIGFQCINGGLKQKILKISKIEVISIVQFDYDLNYKYDVAVYDKISQKIIFSTISFLRFNWLGCSSTYSIIFGKTILLTHIGAFNNVLNGTVFDVNNMVKINKRFEQDIEIDTLQNITVEDKTEFQTSFINDASAGYACSNDITIRSMTGIVIIEAQIPAMLQDKYTDNTVQITFDKSNAKIQLTSIQTQQFVTCSTGSNVYIKANGLKFVHSQALQTTILNNRVFDIRAMQIQNELLILSQPSSAQITSFFDNIAVDLEVGFQCIVNQVLKFYSLVVRTPPLASSITTTDPYMDNTAILLIDPSSNKIQLTTVQPKFQCNPCQLFIHGANGPKFLYSAALTSPIMMDSIFSEVAMVKQSSVAQYIDFTISASFWQNFVQDPTVGFLCNSQETILRILTSQSTTITKKDTYIVGSVAIFDSIAKKILITQLDPQYSQFGFRLLLGVNPMLIHDDVLTSVVGLVFELRNMRKYGQSSGITETDANAFYINFISDKQVGCARATNLSDISVAQATIITASIPSTMIDTANTGVARFDSVQQSIGLALTNIHVVPDCNGPLQFTLGTNPRVIHIYPFPTFTQSTEVVLSISLLQKLDTSNGNISDLSASENTGLLQSLQNDQMVGLVCSSNHLSAQNYLASITTSILIDQDKSINSVFIYIEKTKIMVRFVQPIIPMCSRYKVSFGLLPKFIHPKVFQSIPTSNEVFAVEKMKRLNTVDGTVVNLTNEESTAFNASVSRDLKIGLVCLSDQKIQTSYDIKYVNFTTIAESDTYKAQTVPSATENKVTYDQTAGIFTVGVKDISSPSQFQSGDIIRMSALISSTVSGLKLATTYETEPVEFQAAQANVVGGKLSALVTLVPKAADKVAVDALIASEKYSSKAMITVNNAATPLTIEIIEPATLSVGAIVGIIIGVIALAIVITISLLYYKKKRKNNSVISLKTVRQDGLIFDSSKVDEGIHVVQLDVPSIMLQQQENKPESQSQLMSEMKNLIKMMSNQVQSPQPQNSELIQCKNCSGQFFSSEDLTSHQRICSARQLQSDDVLECKCFLIFTEIDDLKRHMLTCDRLQDYERKLVYKCPLRCGLRFETTRMMATHVESHALRDEENQ